MCIDTAGMPLGIAAAALHKHISDTQQHFPFLESLPYQTAKRLFFFFFEHLLAERITFLKEEKLNGCFSTCVPAHGESWQQQGLPMPIEHGWHHYFSGGKHLPQNTLKEGFAF